MDATKIEKAIKRNGEYWKRRFDFLEQVEHSKTTEYIKDLNELYGKAISNCDTEISKWYQRLADNNGISFTEAKKLLNKNELKEFKWTVEEYIKHGKENAVNQKWIKELENASAKVHISRLEAMKMQMRQQVELITANEAQGVEGLLKDVYEDSYYRSIFELQKGFGIGTSFSRLNSDTISKIIHKPWAADGSDFSERIWGKYRPELINHLHTELTQAFIRGENPKTLAKAIAKKFETTQARAENLVLTESAFFRASGQKKAYENMNVDKFEILATLDSRTSELCRYMDGKVFETKDLQVGVNHPPFHNRCRSTSVPYFDDEFTAWEERIAKDKDGKYYYVPANITYDEWIKNMSGVQKAAFVKSVIMYKNRSSDKKQYEAYTKRLGKENIPKTFDLFQDLKYNDPKQWSLLKDYYKSRGTNIISAFSTFDDYVKYKKIIDSEIVGLVTSDGVTIKGQSKHFIERVLGTGKDPHTGRPRSGVKIEDIKEALLHGEIIPKRNSVKYRTEKCEVSVNPKTGILIQTNPQ